MVKLPDVISLAFLIFLVWTIRESNPAKFIANDFRLPWNIIAHIDIGVGIEPTHKCFADIRVSTSPTDNFNLLSGMLESNQLDVSPGHAYYRYINSCICGGVGIRTQDLLVMSQSSYHCSTPLLFAMGCIVRIELTTLESQPNVLPLNYIHTAENNAHELRIYFYNRGVLPPKR